MDGLRFGRNGLTLKVWNSKGQYTVKRWNVTRSRRLPIAEAGPRERVVTPRSWTTVDATQSRPTTRGGKLSYRWRIVGAPKGAKPRLVNPTAANPRFKTDVPGVYQLGLSVIQKGRGAAAASVASPAQDVITVDAVPALLPQGFYVDTGLYGQSSPQQGPFTSLSVEGQTYTNATGGHPDNWVQLDATTRTVVASGTHDQIQPAAGTITIGQWEGVNLSDASWNQAGSAQNGSQVWLGTTLVASNHSNQGDGSAGNPNTNLHGWIQPASSDTANNYTWFGSDMLQVQTRSATDTASTNTMTDQWLDVHADAARRHQRRVPPRGARQRRQPPSSNQLFPLTGDQTADGATEDNLAATIAALLPGHDDPAAGVRDGADVPAAARSPTRSRPSAAASDVVDRFNGHADSTGGVYSLIAGPSPSGNNSWSTGWRAIEASDERNSAIRLALGAAGARLGRRRLHPLRQLLHAAQRRRHRGELPADGSTRRRTRPAGRTGCATAPPTVR